jgi:hypothetical protein
MWQFVSLGRRICPKGGPKVSKLLGRLDERRGMVEWYCDSKLHGWDYDAKFSKDLAYRVFPSFMAWQFDRYWSWHSLHLLKHSCCQTATTP